MFIQPIVDLWTGRPFAYVLTDKKGCPLVARTPRELYLNIRAARLRDFTPLVVCRPESMRTEAWDEFICRVPDPIWVYENAEIRMEVGGNVVMCDTGSADILWRRHIDNQDLLEQTMAHGIHFGSGEVLMGVDELSVSIAEMYRVEWGT